MGSGDVVPGEDVGFWSCDGRGWWEEGSLIGTMS